MLKAHDFWVDTTSAAAATLHWSRPLRKRCPSLRLQLLANGVPIVEVHVKQKSDKTVLWFWRTAGRRSRCYTDPRKCIQAVEKLFDISIN